jgi:hypothetical protein
MKRSRISTNAANETNEPNKSLKKQRTSTSQSPNKIKNYERWSALDKKVSENSDWISATKTKNYLIKDPVLDWIDKYYLKYSFGEKNINKKKLNMDRININNELNIMTNTLFKKGNEFEKLIYKEFEKRVGIKNCVDVILDYKECCLDKMNDTIKYMEEGFPIIRQAVLYNETNHTFGIADLLIRSDYINEIFDDNIEHINVSDKNIGCKFSRNYHYRVIDIKWSQIQMCSDGFKILNTERFPAYKGQLSIYNLALGKIQNYIPDTAYILGKSYKFEFCSEIYSSVNSFDRLGHILFDDFDEKYIELTGKAVEWYRELLNEGYKWNIITNKRTELCPNMCNTNDSPFTDIKQELAMRKAELTSIWRVSIKNREIAHTNNIFSWKDEKCCSDTMGISKNIAPIVDCIIRINQSEKQYSPDKIKSELYNWRDQQKYVDFYIDFETINDVFYRDEVSVENNKNINYIFMVGVGYFDFNNNWIFKEFHMEKLTNKEEVRVINEFKEYIYKVFEQMKKLSTSKIRFFHWSQAEVTFLENFNNKSNLTLTNFLNKIEFADLYKLFTSEPICINGSLSFKLKDISKSLNRHGLIKSNWDGTNVASGLNAMLDGCYYYKCIDNNKINHEAAEKFNNIIAYNEIDCKVIGEMVQWMRADL